VDGDNDRGTIKLSGRVALMGPVARRQVGSMAEAGTLSRWLGRRVRQSRGGRQASSTHQQGRTSVSLDSDIRSLSLGLASKFHIHFVRSRNL